MPEPKLVSFWRCSFGFIVEAVSSRGFAPSPKLGRHAALISLIYVILNDIYDSYLKRESFFLIYLSYCLSYPGSYVGLYCVSYCIFYVV